MNPFDYYDAGHLAGLEGNYACPHFAFTLPWLWWHAGNVVGHHTMCSQLEAIALLFEQD